ncbi:MAG: ABC transporter ATP-binding protein [Candidatus Pacebacteria bacterium]|nr:ABC transporter ATP-binding protein [Candidatus Paceibacterota bacterium]
MAKTTTAPLLTVTDLTLRFGGLVAVDHINLTAEKGEITAVIGPNGAGKTTLFNCLTGFYKPTSGESRIHRDGRDFILESLPPTRLISDAGICRTFQNIRLFQKMTVLENLIIAQHPGLMRASVWSIAGLLGTKKFRAAEAAAVAQARQWMERFDLLAYADLAAGNLPYGVQRRVEIARALCTHPVLLCLDEPAAGLNATESARLNELLLQIRRELGIGILLIEHDMSVVMQISDRIFVLDHGKVIASGTPAEIRKNPAVIAAYLGVEEEEEPAVLKQLSKKSPTQKATTPKTPTKNPSTKKVKKDGKK